MHRSPAALTICRGVRLGSGGLVAVSGVGWLSGDRAPRRVAGVRHGLLACLGAGTALAEEDPTVQRMVVFGDSQAQGVAGGLQRVLLDDPHYKVFNRTHPGAALVHSESEWLAPVQNFVGKEKADIAVVMFGANDRLDMRDEKGSYVHFRTDTWRDDLCQAHRPHPRSAERRRGSSSSGAATRSRAAPSTPPI